MRKKFDNGEDPLDPEEQQRGNNPFQGGQGERFFFRGNPFGGGGFPGGGGGHNFKFHFNQDSDEELQQFQLITEKISSSKCLYPLQQRQ